MVNTKGVDGVKSEKPAAPGLKDTFVQEMQRKILDRELLVGTRLPSERTLAEQTQVSRTVVNSGLAELAEQGFLEVRPRQGTYVADYRRCGNLSTLAAIMRHSGDVPDRNQILSILEVRRALEHLSTEQAIRYASDEALGSLGVPLARMAAAPNAAAAAEAAFAFRHELALVGGNCVVPLIYSSLKAPLIALWERFCSLYGAFALVSNTEILYSHLKSRDLDRAACWIDAYLERIISGSQQLYEQS